MSAPEEAESNRALSAEDWKALAAMVIQLFEHWRLNADEMTGLLGLSCLGEHALDRFRSGEALAIAGDLEERVGHLLAIHRLLRTQFPQNRDLAYRWPMTPNRAFGDRTPVALASERGTSGLVVVRTYLEGVGAGDVKTCRTLGEVWASLPLSDRELPPLRAEPLPDDGLPEAQLPK